MKLICLRHPKYNGQGSPELSCKTCCTLYVEGVKARNRSEKAGSIASPGAELSKSEDKAKAAKAAVAPRATASKSQDQLAPAGSARGSSMDIQGFNPWMV